jgi:hypothetical protein
MAINALFAHLRTGLVSQMLLQPSRNPLQLALHPKWEHSSDMRALLLLMLSATCRAEGPFGAWKMNPARSTPTAERRLKSLTIRFAEHAKGEVFTLERIDGDGRTTTTSTILYLDGKPRDFEDLGCSGTQSSRRVDTETVEILRMCPNGGWTRFVRRLSSAQPKELILDITEQHSGGRRSERRLVLEKQEREERSLKK